MAGPGRELGLPGHWAAKTGLGRQVLWLGSQWGGSGGRTVNSSLTPQGSQVGCEQQIFTRVACLKQSSEVLDLFQSSQWKARLVPFGR